MADLVFALNQTRAINSMAQALDVAKRVHILPVGEELEPTDWVAILEAMRPWTGGYRLPNFTFSPEQYADAYDEVTIARLRRAIRSYDPDGVMAIGGVLA